MIRSILEPRRVSRIDEADEACCAAHMAREPLSRAFNSATGSIAADLIALAPNISASGPFVGGGRLARYENDNVRLNAKPRRILRQPIEIIMETDE